MAFFHLTRPRTPLFVHPRRRERPCERHLTPFPVTGSDARPQVKNLFPAFWPLSGPPVVGNRHLHSPTPVVRPRLASRGIQFDHAGGDAQGVGGSDSKEEKQEELFYASAACDAQAPRAIAHTPFHSATRYSVRATYASVENRGSDTGC